MGNKFVTELANITQADSDWWTAFSNAWFTYTIQHATSYYLKLLPYLQNGLSWTA